MKNPFSARAKRTFLKWSVLIPIGLSSLAILPGASYAEERAVVLSRTLRLVRSCDCDSGNGLVPPSACGSGYSRSVQRMYNENPGQMISCCRPRAVQDFLIRCYNACGQPGRAVQKSKHVTGQACDATSSTVGRRYGLSLIPHHGSLHWQD